MNTPKRTLRETSPEEATAFKRTALVGNIEVNELMIMMQKSMEAVMDEKIKTLCTKTDVEDLKQHITDIDIKVESLKNENLKLKEEINQLKLEREKDQQQIRRLVDHGRRKNVIFRGLVKEGTPINSVQNICKNVLKLPNVLVTTARVIHTASNSKISVVAEMQNQEMAELILKNTVKLAGSTVKIERDLNENQQVDRKVMMQLKTDILLKSKTHRVMVKNSSIKIGTQWMSWNSNKILVSGDKKAADILKELYGEIIEDVSLNYHQLLQKSNQKN